jgi:CheY-like chemotaxis protein
MGILSAAVSLFGFGSNSDEDEDGKNGETIDSRPKPTVLVIDDDVKFLQSVRTLLGDAGYGVLTSATGPKGLDMLRYAPRDVAVVLLDFGMPRFNGAETLEYLRKLSDQVKIIGVTGYKATELPATFQEGVDRVMAKPFNNGDLLHAIEDVLARKPATPSASPASA